MSAPRYIHFVVGAALGACAGVWVRAIGALALNDFLDWPHLKHFLVESGLIPEWSVYAFMAFLVIGSPLFFWARRYNWLSWRLFAGGSGCIGYLAASPTTPIPSWAFIYAAAGFVSGVVCYATMRALTIKVRS